MANLGQHLMDGIDYELAESIEWINYQIFCNALRNKRQEVVEAIIRDDFKKASKRHYSNTLLHLAVEQEDIDVIKVLLDKKALIKIKNYLGETPLHLAINKNNAEIVDIIFTRSYLEQSNKKNPNPTDNRGLSHMHIACISKHSCNNIFVLHFLKQGVSVNIPVNLNSPNWPGYTPLHFAAEHNNMEIAKLLLQHGADISAKNVDGYTPLHIAFLKICTPMIDLLLSAHDSFKNNVNPINSVGLSHFHIACSKNNTNVVQGFLNRGADINSAINFDSWEFCGFTALHMAVQFECTDIIELLINHGANTGAKEARGLTPLHLAFKNKSKIIIDLLLTDELHRKNENPTNEWGLSHFHIACMHSKLSIIKSLLQNGVSVSHSVDKGSSNYPGYTALHFAAEFERVEVAEILLKWNASVDVKETQGLTPLHLACQQSIKKICNLILQNIEIDSRMHRYQLEEKVNDIAKWFNNRKQYINFINLLLKHNANVNSKDYCDRTPLYYACDISKTIVDKLGIKITGALMNKLDDIRSEMIDTLLQHNADILSCNAYTGETILYHLIDINESLFFIDISKAKIVELFLSRGADVNVKPKSGLTLLHLAVTKGLTKVVRVLLKYNANVNTIENVNLATPLHKAAENLNADIVQMLVDNGADVNARKKDGKTALHDLVSNSSFDVNDRKAELLNEIMERLLEAGCDVDVVDNEGKTSLHIACSALNYVAAHNLLQNGADMNIEDDSGKTPLLCCLFRCRGSFHQIYYCFDDHINKLKRIGYHISKKNKIYFLRIRKMHDESFCYKSDLYLSNEYQNEFKVMKYKRIGNSSLYDMLKKNLNELAIYVKNKTFKKIISSKKFKQKFPFFGYLLKLQYKRGCARANLLKRAKESLEYLINSGLPDACAEKIFKHLNNENLNNLIKTKSIIVKT